MRSTTTGILLLIGALHPHLGLGAPLYRFETFRVPDATITTPVDINTAGQIVGIAQVLPGDVEGTPHGFLKAGNTFTIINAPGAGPLNGTTANGINSSGKIVGSFVEEGAVFRSRGYVRAGGNLVPFDVPGATHTEAQGINDQGTIVGHAFLSSDREPVAHGYILSGGVYKFFDVPGAIAPAGTNPQAINDSGDVVGTYAVNGVGFQSFLYDGTQFSAIDVPGSSQTMVADINNLGALSGTYLDASSDSHGFLKLSTGFYRVDVPGIDARWGTTVTGINDAGVFIGTVTPDLPMSVTSLGFIATPCEGLELGCVALPAIPEASSLATVLVGLVLVLMMNQGREFRTRTARISTGKA
jgi:hypothetical protein